MKNKLKTNIKIAQSMYSQNKFDIVFLSIFSLILTVLTIVGMSMTHTKYEKTMLSAVELDGKYHNVQYYGDKSILTDDISAVAQINSYTIAYRCFLNMRDTENYSDNMSVLDTGITYVAGKVIEKPSVTSKNDIVGHMPITYDEIVITDYLADRIMKYGLKSKSKIDNIQDLIGTQIVISNQPTIGEQWFTGIHNKTLTICGIVDTDYEKYNDLENIKIKDINQNYLQLCQDYFSSRNFLPDIKLENELDRIIIDFIQECLFCYSNAYVLDGFQINEYNLFGQISANIDGEFGYVDSLQELKDDEVVVSVSNYINELDYNKKIDINNYQTSYDKLIKSLNIIGKYVNISDNNISVGQSINDKQLKVVGVIDDYLEPLEVESHLGIKIRLENVVHISTNNYKAIVDNIKDQYSNKTNVYCYLEKNSELYEKISINEKDFLQSIFSPSMRLADISYYSVMPFASIIEVISIIFALIFLIFILYFIVSVCKKQQSAMAKLKMLGYDDCTICCIILVPLLLIFIINIILAIGISIFCLYIINQAYSFGLGITLYYINCLPVVLIIIGIIASLTVAVTALMLKLKKVDPIICVKQ